MGGLADIAGRVVEARESAGLSREQLAVKIGCSFSAVRAWEEGYRHPRHGSLAAVALATGRPVAWFYEGLEAA